MLRLNPGSFHHDVLVLSEHERRRPGYLLRWSRLTSPGRVLWSTDHSEGDWNPLRGGRGDLAGVPWYMYIFNAGVAGVMERTTVVANREL
jgi:hypothetical protein